MDLVEIGRIIGPHGVAGHVKVVVTEGSEAAIDALRVWSIGFDAESVVARRVEDSRPHVSARGLSYIVRLDGITSRTAAELLKGARVFADAGDVEDLITTPSESDDLADYEVVNADGEVIGRVVDLRPMPAHDVLVARRPGGEEVMIPWVPDFVEQIDHGERRLTMRLPDGLVD